MALHERYPRLYAAMKRIGYSPAKAVEILLDASRGDAYALHHCRAAAKYGRH
jgi:hypothetical protein